MERNLINIIRNVYGYLSAPKGYTAGINSYKQKKWLDASNQFKQAVINNPNHAHSNFKLGLCLLKLRNTQDSVIYIKKAIELAPYNTQWKTQLAQAERILEKEFNQIPVKDVVIKNTINQDEEKVEQPQSNIVRIINPVGSNLVNIEIKPKILLIPSDYNHRAMGDILPFVEFYKQNFDIYIILRECKADLVREKDFTLVKNGTSFGEYLKFTSEYVIDAGTMNLYYKIAEKNKWVSVWHGIPYKKMFVDLDKKHLAGALRYNFAYDLMISMSDFYSETFLRKDMFYRGEIAQVGCAKVDPLIEKRLTPSQLKQNLGFNSSHKIILYAPQHRADGEFKLFFNPETLLKQIDENCSLLILLPQGNFVSEQYKNNNRVKFIDSITITNALLIADILISDYANIIYDFKKLGKHVVLFHYDYELYCKANPAKAENLTKLAFWQNVATRESRLYDINWKKLTSYNKSKPIPKDLESNAFKKSINIPLDKKIVLYAPTYRQAGAIDLPFSPDKLLESLGDNYILIIKLHYLNSLKTKHSKVIDCTSYQKIIDLMKISDMLISDYSSLVLDYALLNRPIILFQYDYFKYSNERGVYFNFEDYLPKKQIIDREMDLYTLDFKNLKGDNKKLINTFYPLEDGNSTKRIVDKIGFNPLSRKTKDIIFLTNDLNQVGGIAQFIRNMAKYYKQKYNSRIIVMAIKEFTEVNSELHVFDSPYIDIRISSQYLNGGCANILQNTDGIVISLQFSAHLHFQKYLTNANSILMFHGDAKDIVSGEFYGPHLKWLNKGNLYNYKKLLFLTKSNLDVIAPHLAKDVLAKADFIHNSCEDEYCFVETKKDKKHNVAVITRIDEDKNIFALIDFALEVKRQNKDIVVNVYGDGGLKHEFETEIQQQNLQDIIFLRGYEKDKKKIFSENGTLLLLSKSEGFPLVILEAYANGKPVICFDKFTASKDVIQDGITGYLIPYGDFSAAVNAVEKCEMLDHQDIEKFLNLFSNENIFAKWNLLFSSLHNEKV